MVYIVILGIIAVALGIYYWQLRKRIKKPNQPISTQTAPESQPKQNILPNDLQTINQNEQFLAKEQGKINERLAQLEAVVFVKHSVDAIQVVNDMNKGNGHSQLAEKTAEVHQAAKDRMAKARAGRGKSKKENTVDADNN